MDEQLQGIQKDISAYTGKMFRETFGKGPQAVYTSIGYTFMTIYFRNFITPSEKVLLEQDQEMTIQLMRDKLMETVIPELKAYIEIVTGKKVREVYYDWGLHNGSGMITCISSEPFASIETINESYYGKANIEQEIIEISQLAEKAPEEIYSCELNLRTAIIIRNGILVRIEKELIRLGQGELLKRVKRNLEKGYLHNNNHFEKIFNKHVVDSFVDWDFELDKSVIVFFLNPKPPQPLNTKLIDFAT